MERFSKYIVYYKLFDVYYYYDGKKCKTTEMLHELKANQYKLHHSYPETESGLKQYYKDMNVWNEEIKSGFDKCKFDYLSKYNDMIASEHFCLMFIKKHLNQFDEINFSESGWIEKCYNAGIQSCKPNDNPMKVYSYDGKGFYQYILSNDDFYIPTCKGYETILDELPEIEDLKHGIYRVKITSKNPDATMVFAFNSKNHYYYYDLVFAMKHRKLFKIRLIDDGKPNAYLYDNIIKSSSIFGEWNKKINLLKKDFPDNKLLKNLGSKVWGKLVEHNQFIVTQTEMDKNYEKYENYNIIRTKVVGEHGTDEYRKIHYLQDENKPYCYNLRLKAQITSFARNLVGSHAIDNLDDIVRIHTDSISFKKPWKELNKTIFKKEEKSSGLIQFYGCNNYFHQCWNCSTQFKYHDFVKHKCW